jgi:hypothetical protein
MRSWLKNHLSLHRHARASNATETAGSLTSIGSRTPVSTEHTNAAALAQPQHNVPPATPFSATAPRQPSQATSTDAMTDPHYSRRSGRPTTASGANQAPVPSSTATSAATSSSSSSFLSAAGRSHHAATRSSAHHASNVGHRLRTGARNSTPPLGHPELLSQVTDLRQAVCILASAASSPPSAETSVLPIDFDAWHMTFEQSGYLLEFLRRVALTPEYLDRSGRTSLAQRLLSLLQAMHDKTALRACVLTAVHTAIASESLTEVVLTLNDIQIAKSDLELDDDEQQLLAVARGINALMMVRGHAKAAIQRLADIDPTEVYLGYETGLADELNLPVYARFSSKERFSFLSTQDLQEAATAARAYAADEAQLGAFLRTWPAWLAHVSKAADTPWQKITQDKSIGATDYANATCPITLERIKKVVLVPNSRGPRYNAFEFSAFMKWWGEHGTCPLTRSTVPLMALRRPATA